MPATTTFATFAHAGARQTVVRPLQALPWARCRHLTLAADS
ncbi:hypothetical protein [Hydrogenophaga sp. BPS33]|nr:hypothetical protein [Hydrogenophaga sp. BPS33]